MRSQIIIFNSGKNSKLDDISKELGDYQKYEMLEYLIFLKGNGWTFSRNYKRDEFSNSGSTVSPT